MVLTLFRHHPLSAQANRWGSALSEVAVRFVSFPCLFYGLRKDLQLVVVEAVVKWEAASLRVSKQCEKRLLLFTLRLFHGRFSSSSSQADTRYEG
jgi:hypothetical protein